MKYFITIVYSIMLMLWPNIASNATDMTISAAISLTNAFRELKDIFEKGNPQLKISTNFAASNPLLRQIEAGAPVDVFACADQETMDKAAMAKAINPNTRKDFAHNELVVIVPKGNRLPSSLNELSGYNRISIGNPDSVPAGRYTKGVLEKAKLWEKLQPSWILTENVRQALDYVARGEVDAGFVYRTDAMQGKDKVDIAFIVDMENPVTYPIAVAVTGSNPEAAQQFINFVLSEQGQHILEKYGFAKP